MAGNVLVGISGSLSGWIISTFGLLKLSFPFRIYMESRANLAPE